MQWRTVKFSSSSGMEGKQGMESESKEELPLAIDKADGNGGDGGIDAGTGNKDAPAAKCGGVAVYRLRSFHAEETGGMDDVGSEHGEYLRFKRRPQLWRHIGRHGSPVPEEVGFFLQGKRVKLSFIRRDDSIPERHNVQKMI